ncbi:hypothetical protein ACIKTA_12700 [Hansschlegelia beijingensis]
MPREAPRQYPLELPHASRFGTEDYLIGPANAAAHALVTSWPAWPDRLLLLIGEDLGAMGSDGPSAVRS